MDLQLISTGIDRIVKDAAGFIRSNTKSFSKSDVMDKGLNQLVSYIDIETEKILVSGLAELVPEAGFITEENTVDSGRNILNWIIDPLDGTTNFVHGVPVYSISVAMADGTELLAGSVYELGRDELFSAFKQGGARLNGKTISVSEENSINRSLMATGFPYHDFEQLEDYIHVLKLLMQKTHGLRRMGSAAVDLAYVAAGRFEGFFEYGLNPWDIAAGALLVKEAGGEVCDFKGDNDYLFGKTILASNNLLNREFLEILKSSFN